MHNPVKRGVGFDHWYSRSEKLFRLTVAFDRDSSAILDIRTKYTNGIIGRFTCVMDNL